MNKQQIFLQAKRIVDERRFLAEDKAQRNLDTLRQNDEYSALEKQLRTAQVNLAMGNGNAKSLQTQIFHLNKQLNKLIVDMGYKKGDLTPQYHCLQCNDTGYVNNAMCSCLEAEIRAQILAESNITNEKYTFDNSTETNKANIRVYNMAKQICIDGDQNMLLVGNTGSGKTYLLTACANLCAELNRSVLFMTAYTLNGTLLNAHLSDNATNHAILDSLVDVDVLAIDDLGTENVYKNVTAEYFFSVLNERIARKKQTFISTNLTLNDIRERYDERIFSRLVDQNTTFVAQLIGNDKRIKGS